MKTILILLFTQIIFYPTLAQSKNDGLKTIITGTLDKNWGSDSVKFIVTDRANPATSADGRALLRTSIKADNGKFRLEFYASNPVYVSPEYPGWASIPAYQVFNLLSTRYVSSGILIEPGDSIVISSLKKGVADNHGITAFDKTAFFADQTYSGKGAEKLWCIQSIIHNSLLFKYPVKKGVNEDYLNEMLNFSDSVTSMVLNTIEIYKTKLSPAALAIIKAHYIAMMAEDISEIVQYVGLDITIPANSALIKDRIAKSNKIINVKEPFIEYGSFYSEIIQKRALLEHAIDQGLSLNQISNSKFKFQADFYYALKKYIPDTPIKNRVIANYVRTGLLKSGIEGDAEEIIHDYFRSNDPESQFFKDVKAQYNEIKGKYSKGIIAFDFSLPDTTGKIVKLSDFKGKIVVIDFMFTGCPGCIQLVTAMSKIEEKYKTNSDIVFVSISISPDIAGSLGWRSGIGRFSVKGSIQLCAGGKSKTDNSNKRVIKEYNISAYPQLVVIDKNGRLITTTAMRPDVDNGIGLSSLLDKAIVD